jgi:hypothetical protein
LPANYTRNFARKSAGKKMDSICNPRKLRTLAYKITRGILRGIVQNTHAVCCSSVHLPSPTRVCKIEIIGSPINICSLSKKCKIEILTMPFSL